MLTPGQLMHFPVSGVWLDPYMLMLLGLLVGLMGGFFGVGGSFICGPALNFVGVPMNYVVGTDLAQIVGKSVVAAKKHRALGNVDVKLGLFMTMGTLVGVEAGARAIEYLKRQGQVDRVVPVVFLILLVSISSFMLVESLLSLGRQSRSGADGVDPRSFAGLARWVQRLRLGPMVSLPASGIKRISLGAIMIVSCIGGLCSGFLGGGAGYIRMPMMVFVLGIPTHVAVGTDLFEIIVSAGFGTYTHACKGNVDLLMALVIQTGAAFGAQIGAALTQRVHGPIIRLAFVPLPLLGAALLVAQLLRHKGGL